mmetsp:Transcript_18180/g.20880  ORF Transcript_18180/g.20880 Transcript_18180/m.20880 type:complete len:327 (+) Transcript_18180:104-1084(+)
MAVDTLHTTRGDHAGEDLSSTRIFGYDKVVLGTFIVSVVALLLPTLLLFRSKIYPFSHRRPTTTTTSSSFTPPSSESHLVVPFIFLRDSTNSSSQKPLEHTLRSAFIGYQRECSNAMTGLSKMLEMALVSESDRNFHNSIGSNKKNNNNNNNNNTKLSVFAVHPGIVRTNVTSNMNWYWRLGNHIFGWIVSSLSKTAEEGAYSTTYVVSAPYSSLPRCESTSSGGVGAPYIVNCQPQQPHEYITNPTGGGQDSHQLWMWSEQLVTTPTLSATTSTSTSTTTKRSHGLIMSKVEEEMKEKQEQENSDNNDNDNDNNNDNDANEKKEQ